MKRIVRHLAIIVGCFGLFGTLVAMPSAAQEDSREAPADTSADRGTGGTGNVVLTDKPMDLAKAMFNNNSIITGAKFITKAPCNSPSAGSCTDLGDTAGVLTKKVGGFPNAGPTAAVLSSGDAGIFADNDGLFNDSQGGNPIDGRGGAIDVTILRVDFNVPANKNCLSGDFKFYSEEFPSFVGSQFNDAFVIELDNSTWAMNGTTLVAPGNLAVDATGQPVTINTTGATGMTSQEANGTSYGGATSTLRYRVIVSPGQHSLYYSIFDVSDAIYDSTIVADNVSLGKLAGGICELDQAVLAECNGKTATIIAVPGKVTNGTPKADVIVGSDKPDVINGGGGADIICGGKGADEISGGKGGDKIFGGDGKDIIVGGGGKDVLAGGPGKDDCKGGPGKDKQKSC